MVTLTESFYFQLTAKDVCHDSVLQTLRCLTIRHYGHFAPTDLYISPTDLGPHGTLC